MKVASVHYPNTKAGKAAYEAALHSKLRSQKRIHIKPTRVLYPGEYKRNGIHVIAL